MQIAKLEKDRQERLIWEQRERSRMEYLKKNEIFERNQSILKNDVNFTTGKINTIELLSDNEIYVGGMFTGGKTTKRFQNLIKLDSTGSVDFNFTPNNSNININPIFKTDTTNVPTSVEILKLDESGSLYVGGLFNFYSGSTLNSNDINFIKISSESGSLNPLFAKVNHEGYIRTLNVLNSNNILIGGHLFRNNNSPFLSYVDSTNTDKSFNVNRGFAGVLSNDEFIFTLTNIIGINYSSSINDSETTFANNELPERFGIKPLETNLTSSNTIKIFYTEISSSNNIVYNIDGISFCVETGSNLDNYFINSLSYQELIPFVSPGFTYAGDRRGTSEVDVFSKKYQILGPYFHFNISGSNIGLDPNFNNLSYNTILSTTLKK
jgi:hypothetical protein